MFDPLDHDMKRVRLILKEFVLKFDAFDKPVDIWDIQFDFDRKIEQKMLYQK